MSNTYTWTVKRMDVTPFLNNETNVVSSINYVVTATNGTTTVECNNIQTIPFNSANSFVAYSNLTNATVIGWVQSLLGAQKIAEIEANLDAQITNSTLILVTQALPWSIT